MIFLHQLDICAIYAVDGVPKLLVIIMVPRERCAKVSSMFALYQTCIFLTNHHTYDAIKLLSK